MRCLGAAPIHPLSAGTDLVQNSCSHYLKSIMCRENWGKLLSPSFLAGAKFAPQTGQPPQVEEGQFHKAVLCKSLGKMGEKIIRAKEHSMELTQEAEIR